MNQETIPSLEQQLSDLENLYAEYLMENINRELLKAIHYKITCLQSRINELQYPGLQAAADLDETNSWRNQMELISAY